MKVVLAGAEAVPFAKVGGLGDVLGALPRALAREGVDATLVLPRYRGIDVAGFERVDTQGAKVRVGREEHGFGLLRGRLPQSEAHVLLIENDHFFDRFSVYNAEGGRPFPDDAERWLFYQLGVLEACRAAGLQPDVLHAHDSQAGVLGPLLRTRPGWERTAFVYTIHNIAYQGGYPPSVAQLVGFDAGWMRSGSPLEFHGVFNWMKSGISFAEIVTTVSPTYAREIQTKENGVGLDGLLRARSADVVGVLNGIDLDVWSPQKDPRIARNYDVGDAAGKRACKLDLLQRLGLAEADPDRPLLVFIGRLVPQKGCELLAGLARNVLQHDVLFAALGSGANAHEDELRAIAAEFPQKARAVIGFDEDLAHRLQAGADVLLMPSAYEPCGLNQMYAMAYGTVPVVHATGGLADTVQEPETGFVFHEFTAHAFKEAVYRALVAYGDTPRWERMVRAGMTRDFSWSRSAREYLELYERALAQRPRPS